MSDNQEAKLYEAYQRHKIILNTTLGKGIYKMQIAGDFSSCKAGEFFMIKPAQANYLFARPLSVSEVSSSYLELCYAVIGEVTQALSFLKQGDEVLLFKAGSNYFPLPKIKPNLKIALIGGGIGIAPLRYLSRKLCETAEEHSLLWQQDVFLGYRDFIYEDEYFLPFANVFSAVQNLNSFELENPNFSTKVSIGMISNIPDLVAKINTQYYDYVYACGPLPMLKAVSTWNLAPLSSTYLSFEKRMACGFGLCLGCQIKLKDGNNVRCCVEGPVFRADEVNIDE